MTRPWSSSASESCPRCARVAWWSGGVIALGRFAYAQEPKAAVEARLGLEIHEEDVEAHKQARPTTVCPALPSLYFCNILRRYAAGAAAAPAATATRAMCFRSKRKEAAPSHPQSREAACAISGRMPSQPVSKSYSFAASFALASCAPSTMRRSPACRASCWS